MKINFVYFAAETQASDDQQSTNVATESPLKDE